MIILRKVEIEENFLNPPNLTHSGETLEAFPLKPDMGKTCPILHCTSQPRKPPN